MRLLVLGEGSIRLKSLPLWVFVEIRQRQPAESAAAAAFLERHQCARVARLGRLERPADHPALVALNPGLVGLLTYITDGSLAEVLTLHVDEQWRGVGTQLLHAAERVVTDAGCDRLFLVTTNDNVDALRFYQRRGFRLAQLFPGAVERSRATLKPEIPKVGTHGIPIRDELVLERTQQG